MPYLRAMAWSIRWSSGFLWSSWMTLWSMYWTARSTCTRGTSSCSNCMHAIVPVASWSSVWSTRREMGDPGSSSPSTRCSRRICRLRLSADVLAVLKLGHDLVDLLGADRVVLALDRGAALVELPRGGVHADQLGVGDPHERPPGVARVDRRVRLHHVLVGADLRAEVVDGDRAREGGLRDGDGADVG